MNDKRYWAEFYQKHRKGERPSSFAEYVAGKYVITGNKLLELGCGNGRDALFFASKGIQAVAIDQVVEEMEFLNSLKRSNVKFVAGDFSELGVYSNFDYVYSRFTFHSIDMTSENRVLSTLSDVLNSNGLFMLEARSTKDENLNKEFVDLHYRRYLDFEKTVAKVEALGFEILEQVESRGLAPYKSEDPFVLRIIARKSAR